MLANAVKLNFTVLKMSDWPASEEGGHPDGAVFTLTVYGSGRNGPVDLERACNLYLYGGHYRSICYPGGTTLQAVQGGVDNDGAGKDYIIIPGAHVSFLCIFCAANGAVCCWVR